MLEVLALDALLLLILLLLIPIGMYRGGLREVCSAAGMLLGVLIASVWSARWGDWLSDLTGIDQGVSRFVAAVGTMVVCAAVVGYGAAASFDYRPGPGGRLYGGVIALLIGVVFLGAVVQYVATYLYDGIYPELIRQGYLSRALSMGFDWTLLMVAFGSLAATLFGMLVRERDTDAAFEGMHESVQQPRRPTVVPSAAPEPVKIEAPQVTDEDVTQTASLKIHEVRHWEEPTPPTMSDLRSGWSRTWPADVARSPDRPAQGRPGGTGRGKSRAPQPVRSDRVIQDWLAEDNERRRRDHPLGRPDQDE